MSKQANPARIGVFVIGALVLAVSGALVFGTGGLFRDSEYWVVYFQRSVSGLDVGAPVVFRGVTVGSVSDIKAFYHQEDASIEIPVIIEMVSGRVLVAEGGRISDDEDDDAVDRLIQERGMRAQLSLQSFVTGKLYVSLDLFPDSPLEYRGRGTVDLPEIPSMPSVIEEAQAAVEQLITDIRKLPMDEMANSVMSAFQSADELLSSPDLAAAIASSDEALIAFRKVMEGADEQIGPLGKSLLATSDQAQAALESIELALGQLRTDLAAGSPLNYQLMTTLQDVSEASRSLRALANAIQREPDSLLFGRGRSGDE